MLAGGDALTAKEAAQILTVFDVAARRGAFTAEEFVEVGTLYLKLKSVARPPPRAAREGSAVISRDADVPTFGELSLSSASLVDSLVAPGR
jgi:hypothetical protein